MRFYIYFKTVNNKKAQIILPAILLIPTILLVIYLLFETTKLSVTKIREQFSLDTAAFVELTSASVYLNATAYVNGAFPFRLFRENLAVDNLQVQPNEDAENAKPISLFELFYKAGAFPAMDVNNDYNTEPKDNDTTWELHYYTEPYDPEDSFGGKEETENPRANWNTENPTADEDKVYDIMFRHYAKTHIMPTEIEAARLYMTIYYLLDTIYENQKKVYQRLTKNGEFFRKAFYLNMSNCKMSECGKQGALQFQNYIFNTEPIYIKTVRMFYYSTGENMAFVIPLVDLNFSNGRLFQFAYLTKTARERLRKIYSGVEINQPFQAPSNYFNIGLSRFNPHVHVRAALQCPRENNNCVWPNPTPKYQVRLYP